MRAACLCAALLLALPSAAQEWDTGEGAMTITVDSIDIGAASISTGTITAGGELLVYGESSGWTSLNDGGYLYAGQWTDRSRAVSLEAHETRERVAADAVARESAPVAFDLSADVITDDELAAGSITGSVADPCGCDAALARLDALELELAVTNRQAAWERWVLRQSLGSLLLVMPEHPPDWWEPEDWR